MRFVMADKFGRFVSVTHATVVQAKVDAGVEKVKQELETTPHVRGGNSVG